MSKLFIIGNGFDLDHGLKTRYSDFEEYLIRTYPESKEQFYSVPEKIILPDGGEEFNKVDVVSFIRGMIANTVEENWCDLEESLGRLDFSDYFYNFDEFEEKDRESRAVILNEDTSENIKEIMPKIKELILEWIRTIETNDAIIKEDFEKLIEGEKNLFLNFNYTDTLEMLYDINPYYIHGERCSEFIEFGHGNKRCEKSQYWGSEDNILDVMKDLRKNVYGIIRENKEFYDSIDSSIDEIYSYGFSFSDVDLPYIKEILKRVNGKIITWYLNKYDNKETICENINKIIKCKFKGKFKLYEISN